MQKSFSVKNRYIGENKNVEDVDTEQIQKLVSEATQASRHRKINTNVQHHFYWMPATSYGLIIITIIIKTETFSSCHKFDGKKLIK